MSASFVLALVPLAAAQAPAPERSGGVERSEADGFVAQGISLRAQGKDREALAAFQKAAAIDPSSVRVQIHLATVYQALGDWLQADEYLSKALAQQDHPYVARHRQVLEDARRVIDSNIGRLDVEGEPAGAEVRLNGRFVGTLPFAEPARVTTGSYVLEVRREGHYPMQRPIAITGGGLVREAIHLEPVAAGGAAPGGYRGPSAASAGGAELDTESRGGPAWLTWTLGGAAAASAALAVGAWIIREEHAGRWNDNARCLELDRTRAQVCGDERDGVESAQTVAVVSGVVAGLLGAGAALNGFGVFEPDAPPEGLAFTGCRVGLGALGCTGAF